jgi:molybdopterin converting factor small subunit
MFATKKAQFRFYEELNDFLVKERQKRSFTYQFSGNPTIKDAIEACGVPHPEVEIILINGISEGFDYHLKDGDRVAIYPIFESLDDLMSSMTGLIRIRKLSDYHHKIDGLS